MYTAKKLFVALPIATFAFVEAWANESVNFVKRSWDNVNKRVVDTDTSITDYVELDGSNKNGTYTLESGKWYVVKKSFLRNEIIAPLGDAANLLVFDGATLSSRIIIDKDHSLNIFGQSGDSGKIIAEGYSKTTHSEDAFHYQYYTATSRAAIGSGGDMGTLVIHGGTITATSYVAAGIGGGGYKSSTEKPVTGKGGDVTIYGGTVTARGGTGGAGIGGCYDDGGVLTIYGGKVTATSGGLHTAGIGGGNGHKDYGYTFRSGGGVVNIYGGSVVARGSEYAAGIGGGENGSGGTVTIWGGNVKAYGGADGAGIGSGEQLDDKINGGTVTIYGGYVEAHGGDFGAGIGGGQDASGATVVIYNGTVAAFGGDDAAGIGSGEEYVSGPINGGSLTVYGGDVFADGTGWGAGIGAGQDADGAVVEIYGGKVVAWAGENAGKKNGSAIGSAASEGHYGKLYIADSLKVKAGQSAYNISLFPFETRVPACRWRPYARIEQVSLVDKVNIDAEVGNSLKKSTTSGDARIQEGRLDAVGSIGRHVDHWYDLQGRKLNGRPTDQGKYLHNGRVEIVR